MKSKNYLYTQNPPKYEGEYTMRKDNTTLGSKYSVEDITKLNEGINYEFGFAGHFNHNIFYGGLQKFVSDKTSEYKYSPTTCHLYCQYKGEKNVGGAEFNYDHLTKAYTSRLALKMKMDDHTWKFRFHDSGLARAALQWQLHKSTKATLNTSFNLRDVPAGKISSLPLGLTLEVKY